MIVWDAQVLEKYYKESLASRMISKILCFSFLIPEVVNPIRKYLMKNFKGMFYLICFWLNYKI